MPNRNDQINKPYKLRIMKYMKHLLLALFAGSLFFAACKKDSDSKSASDIITGGSTKSWKIQSRKIDNVASTIDSCDADDVMTFTKSGNTFASDPGTKTCGDIPISGTWALSNDDKTVTVSGVVLGMFPFTQTLQIKELSDTKAVVTYTNDDSTNVRTFEDTIIPK